VAGDILWGDVLLLVTFCGVTFCGVTFCGVTFCGVTFCRGTPIVQCFAIMYFIYRLHYFPPACHRPIEGLRHFVPSKE
jgi:hypothetical protein